MNQQNINSNELTMVAEAENHNLKRWIFRILGLWPWFIVSLLVCLLLAYLYLRNASPVYQSIASLMVKDETKEGNSGEASRLREMGLTNDSKLVVNEIEVLKSYDLIEQVVDSLGLFMTVKQDGQLKHVDIFGDDLPFIIQVKNPEDIIKTRQWTVSYSNNGVLFKSEFDQQPILLKPGQYYNSEGIIFRCLPRNKSALPEMNEREKNTVIYKIYLNSPDATAIQYGSKLSVDPANKLATIINLQMKDTNRKRAKAFLQTLLFFYGTQELENKNKIAENTIAFLNDRLVEVANELGTVEARVEKFKSANRVTSLSTDAEKYLESSQQVDVQKAQIQTQLNIVNALQKSLQLNQDNPRVVPTTYGIQDQSLNQLVEKYNDLVLQNERVQQKLGPKNPLLIDLNNQIKEVQSRMLTNVDNLKKAYGITLNDINQKDIQLSNRIRNVPQLEKGLIQITRSQNVQENLYSYLLQKREEAAVAKASNIEGFQTIVEARDLGIISPNSKIIWGISFLMGLILPVAFVSLKDFMNSKVGEIHQVEQHTNVPLLGAISHVKKLKSPIIIDAQSRTPVADQIRNIRTSISFSGQEKEVKSILVTSFQPGDGKSFVSLNLAAGYALLNKKTVLLEFDLRRPHISKDLGLDGHKGISNILNGELTVDDLLVEIPGYDNNLFLLPAGYMPPNPAELISGSRMACLMKRMQELFDYIIIDTPSFSFVPDTTLLQQYTDVTLVVLREGHTSQEVYTVLQHWIAKRPDNPVYLLLNDGGEKKEYQGKGYYYKEKG